MKWMGVEELRELFLSFFEKKGHKRLESFSLVPKNDSSLLFVNSGMAPMKKWFLNQQTPLNKRVTTAQRCLRTADLKRVGVTNRHGTFFEMLGNFSFGDYFKEEAICFAYEFVFEVLKMPKEKIYISVFEKDEEALKIWKEKLKINSSHIKKFGKKDNFWEIGTGPCGPCSELYYDRGEEYSCKKKDCGFGCECDRFIEFYNLVFSQYEKKENGEYVELASKNIDTGMGLERLALIVQNAKNLFEVDSVKKILLKVCEVLKVNYKEDEKKDVLIRTITDHIRSIVFLIFDGVLPSNETRGYVLRKLIRRAHGCGRKLAIFNPFLFKLVEVVLNSNKKIKADLNYIKTVIKNEEERFIKILKTGESKVLEVFNKLKKEKNFSNVIDGKIAFKFCDTYGFPYDIFSDLAAENGFKVKEEEFLELLNKQKQMAKRASSFKENAWKKNKKELNGLLKTEFLGYLKSCCKAKILQIFKTEKEDEFEIVFDKTPIYATSGGQVADQGQIFLEEDEELKNSVAEILDCKKLESGHFLHRVKGLSSLKKGENVFLKLNSEKREQISKNHTAAHIFHKALDLKFKTGATQAGQLITEEKIRFDFFNFSKIEKKDLKELEDMVNNVIFKGLEVKVLEMEKQKAEQEGAVALFEEKYGEIVRVVEILGFSKEFCGGTHVKNTKEIGGFKIISSSSVGSGVQRIEAITGKNILKHVYFLQQALEGLFDVFKVKNNLELEQKAKSTVLELKKTKQQLKEIRLKFFKDKFFEHFKQSFLEVKNSKAAFFEIEELKQQEFHFFADLIAKKQKDIVALIFVANVEKVSFFVVCGDFAVRDGFLAKLIVKKILEVVKAKGGGKENFAMAGLKNSSEKEKIKLTFFKTLKEGEKK